MAGRTLSLGRLLAVPLLVGAILACDVISARGEDISDLCRAHFGNVTSFRWFGGMALLPVEAGIPPEQDRRWRERFDLPALAGGPSMLTKRISAVEPLGDGWLVGTDGGEWGGALYFVHGGAAPQEVQRGNVRALHPVTDGVLAVFGLAHMGTDEGHYRRIALAPHGVEFGDVTPLPGAPIDLARDGGRLFMAGGFDERGGRTWARVLETDGTAPEASVARVCP